MERQDYARMMWCSNMPRHFSLPWQNMPFTTSYYLRIVSRCLCHSLSCNYTHNNNNNKATVTSMAAASPPPHPNLTPREVFILVVVIWIHLFTKAFSHVCQLYQGKAALQPSLSCVYLTLRLPWLAITKNMTTRRMGTWK